jgi:hypothetical protein
MNSIVDLVMSQKVGFATERAWRLEPSWHGSFHGDYETLRLPIFDATHSKIVNLILNDTSFKL